MTKYLGVELVRPSEGGEPEPRRVILLKDPWAAENWIDALRPGRRVVIRRVYALGDIGNGEKELRLVDEKESE